MADQTTTTRWDAGIDHLQESGAICVRFRERKIVDMMQIEAMSEELARLTADEGSRLVLDLSGVEFLASAALNKLVSLERRLRSRAGQLALCGLTSTVQDVFSITRLTSVFSIHPDQAAALAALK